MADQTPLLRVSGLKTYFETDEGTVKAIEDATFDVGVGEVVGIVGESGCGKSVTARSILRIVEKPGRIVEGTISFTMQPNGERIAEEAAPVSSSVKTRSASQTSATTHDRVVELTQLDDDGPAIRSIRGRHISYVFQEPMTSFSPVHTIGAHLSETIRLHLGFDKRRARTHAIEYLRLVGIPKPDRCFDSYPFELSGGLRQRAMIAVALCCEPRLLIADEPTTALDVTTQAQILELLKKIQAERSMSVMLITHNLGVIAEMAESVVVMYLGRVVEQGPVVSIFDDPRHPYTRALLKSIPSVQSTPKTKLPTIRGGIPHPFNRPVGCPFHTRCEYAIAGKCDVEAPSVYSVDAKHTVSCFLFEPNDLIEKTKDVGGAALDG